MAGRGVMLGEAYRVTKEKNHYSFVHSQGEFCSWPSNLGLLPKSCQMSKNCY